MKTKSMQLGRWAVGRLLLAPILPTTVRSQSACPCSWYEAVPPNPESGLPPTLGEMLPVQYYDTEHLEAFFLVPLEGLQSLLPQGVRALGVDAELSPWRVLGPWPAGLGVLNVGFVDNHSVQYLGPYSEASILATRISGRSCQRA